MQTCAPSMVTQPSRNSDDLIAQQLFEHEDSGSGSHYYRGRSHHFFGGTKYSMTDPGPSLRMCITTAWWNFFA